MKRNLDILNHAMILRYRSVALTAAFFFLLFSILDRWVYPEHVTLFLVIRLVGSFCWLIGFVLTYFKPVQSKMIFLVDFSIIVSGVTISWMMYLADGAQSAYYQGLHAVFIAMLILNSFYLLHNILSGLLILFAYTFAIARTVGDATLPNVLSAYFYLGTTLFLICLLTSVYGHQYRRLIHRSKALKETNKSLKHQIVERKQAQEQLIESLQALEQSNQDLEQYAYAASHDLQSPLRQIAGFAQLLTQRYEDSQDPKVQEYLHYILSGTKRMQTLIRDLLDFSKVGSEELAFEPTDMNALVSEVLHQSSALIEQSGAKVACHFLPTLNINRTQMRQLFANLIANAIKYYDEEGVPMIEVSANHRMGEWVFSVEDNGPGIAPEYRERVFTLFQRLDNQDESAGTGIGLAICRRIVERHGGKIWIESSREGGARFMFNLPHAA